MDKKFYDFVLQLELQASFFIFFFEQMTNFPCLTDDDVCVTNNKNIIHSYQQIDEKLLRKKLIVPTC